MEEKGIHTSALKHHNLIIDTNLQCKLYNESESTRVQKMASTGLCDMETDAAEGEWLKAGAHTCTSLLYFIGEP